ncbi:MAG: HlyD family secretion protein [Bacteroidota bacterium]|nr:HlyD family secretion protein [Bacteroidota bacterium]MDP4217390.1 HlyD family secretion protein [Bacteroidota bacterium]MDP4245724.1 HlyD family secretion protein [Bacteroidota bacterium]MDP4254259.1 HlyD family secretion protein [Bacteroidota bacterium]MDP4260716.1 HlyD family secretion protein [Bacteroidota bacterium]
MNENQPKRKGKKLIFPIILALVLIGALAFTAKEYFYYQSHEVTDDAQIDGDISPVIARASGYVREIRFTDNQFVHAGDTLVVLDDRDYRIKLQQAEAGLSSVRQSVDVSQGQVTEARSGVGTAEANVEAAKVRVNKANLDFERYQNLYNDKAITKAQYDDAKAEKDEADAALKVAQSQVPVQTRRVSTNERQVGATASNLASRQADIDFAKLQLSYTVITAPTDGIASKRLIQVGQLVQAGQTMVAIVNTKSMYITANFKETQLEHLHIGEKVDITVDAYGDKTMQGAVESFSGSTGAKMSLLPPDNATGNFVKVVQRLPVRIKIETDSSFTNLLRPGMSVSVVVHTK